MSGLWLLLVALLGAGRVWPTGPVPDQGALPACVGYAWVAWGAAGSLGRGPWPDGLALYRWAQAGDGLPDTAPGTTLEAAARALQHVGLVRDWRITGDPGEAAWWLATRGPVVVGSSWTLGMDTPVDGTLEATGPVLNQHAYLLYGEIGGDTFLAQNTWGPADPTAYFRITAATLAALPYHAFALATKMPPGALSPVSQ